MSKAKAKEPSKGGMPRFVPTDEDRAIVKLLIANGFAQHVVCKYISNRRGSHIGESTLKRAFAHELKVGKVELVDEFGKLAVIRSDIACEGLWMVTKNPDLNNYGHVLALSRRIPFILPAQGSGSAASFAFLQANDPDGLGRVPEANKRYVADATAVLNETALSTNGAVGFFVQFADPENANIKLMTEKDLNIIPVVSREILHIRLNARGVYQLQTFNLKAGGVFVKPTEATTACTPVAVITGSPEAFGSDRDKIDDQKDLIQKVSEVPPEKLLPQESRVAAVIRYAKKLTEQTADEMVALVEKGHQIIESRDR